ncbi:hypothetical protein [Luteimonas panaciterrae]|uniref:hypothetical protein n=1 Tax=Luteimonas panaciterrae TaxID=363885 RepID=UPI001CFC0BF9|nr:hypothetical protein [Luteimonas panaciterrae]
MQQDWSDAIAQGILCKRCVLPLEDDLAPGPRLCHWCREEDRIAALAAEEEEAQSHDSAR